MSNQVRLSRLSLLAAFGLALGACTSQNNPVASVPSNPSPVNYYGYQEVITPDVLFSPTGFDATQTNSRWGGAIQLSYGGWSSAYVSNPLGSAPVLSRNSSGSGDPSLPAFASPHSNLPLLGPGNPDPNGLKGIGGASGSQSDTQDYFLRYAGRLGTDPSLDYCSLSLNFVGPSTAVDISGYRGFIFFARGTTGTYAVELKACSPPDGCPGPYKGYNYYAKVFGNQLAGPSEWRQIVVDFKEMQQLYGQAVDLQSVLKNCYGLLFTQESPKYSPFQVDIDYIRFYK